MAEEAFVEYRAVCGIDWATEASCASACPDTRAQCGRLSVILERFKAHVRGVTGP